MPMVRRALMGPIVAHGHGEAGARCVGDPTDREAPEEESRPIGRRVTGPPQQEEAVNEKFQPGEEIFDETEGHGRKGPGIVAEDEATEGHMPRIRLAVPEDEESDEAEGHVFRH